MTRPLKTMNTPSTLPLSPRPSHIDSIHSTGALTDALIGLFHSLPDDPTSKPEIPLAMPEIRPVASSSGRSKATAKKLKKSWTVAAAKARLNSADARRCARDTSVLVTVVPMLAPMISGHRLLDTQCLTGDEPDDHRGTGRRRLNQDGSQDPDEQAGQRVVDVGEQLLLGSEETPTRKK